MTPLQFLQLPYKQRLFQEMYLIAKGLKEKAAYEKSREKQEQGSFDQQAQAWEHQVAEMAKKR